MNLDDNNYVDFEETKPEKDNRRTIIIVAAVLLVVCCCCIGLGYGLWTWGDAIIEWFGTIFAF